MCSGDWRGQEENLVREMPQKVLRRDGAGVSQDHVPRYRDHHHARQTETEAYREVTNCKKPTVVYSTSVLFCSILADTLTSIANI